jgi:hypothetical protein
MRFVIHDFAVHRFVKKQFIPHRPAEEEGERSSQNAGQMLLLL